MTSKDVSRLLEQFAQAHAAEMREVVMNADRPYPIAIFHESVTKWAEAILALGTNKETETR